MDAQAQVRLVFAGELLEGHSLDEVKRLFGELFKLEGERLAAVFSGQRTVLKRAVGREDGERYLARLSGIGMRVIAEPLDDWPELTPLPAAAVAAPAAPASRVAPPPPLTMASPPPVAAPVALPAPAAAAPALSGPSLVPLEEEVTCPNCHERQPKKFVLCRQCSTDIPRALAHQQEERDRALAERQAARQGGRFAPPRAEVGDEEEPLSGETVEPPPFISLSFEGRYGRASYIGSGGVAMLGIAILGVLTAGLLPMFGKLIFVPLLPAVIVLVLWSLRVGALRLHDFNRSGWWILLSGIPYVGWLVYAVMVFWPGTSDDNDFGPKPKQGSLVLAGVVVLVNVVIFAVVLAVALPAYQGYVKRAQGPQDWGSQREQEAEAYEQAVSMPQGPALQAFRNDYAPAANEKAFAISGAGAYGWAAGKRTPREAVSAALSDCDQRREAYTGQCQIVNINGMTPKP